jgi:3-hydroxyisobutyrate dehydrogenase
MIAFFGMGLLGSNFVRALRKRGEEVAVFNRTLERARQLEVEGATAFEDPAEAVKGAAELHLTLSVDEAVDEVLERARPGFAPTLLIVDHTTTSPAGTKARAERWRERGIAFLHAPVFMGPQNALESTGIMLVSGDGELIRRARPRLEKMTGKLVELGPAAERAAGFKLLGNLFLMFMTAGVAEVLTLAKALDIPAADAAALFDAFNPGAMLPARLKKVVSKDFKASWELTMARKDARLMVEAGAAGLAPLEMLPAIAEVMDRFIQRGHGRDDWTIIASDALTPRTGKPAAGV